MPISHTIKRPNAAVMGEEVLAFSMELEENLVRACDELQNLTYQPGDYTVFKVWEPKERTVMALPFYDRVIQHMICNAIEQIGRAHV